MRERRKRNDGARPPQEPSNMADSLTFTDLRRAHYRSRSAFATALRERGYGVSADKVGHWEHARDLPGRHDLPVIADVLGCTQEAVVAALVATMRAKGRMPPAVDWAPDVWYGPCALLLQERAQRQAEFLAQLAAQYAPKSRSPLDILIDRACGLE